VGWRLWEVEYGGVDFENAALANADAVLLLPAAVLSVFARE